MRIYSNLGLALLLLNMALPAAAINIFTCEPEWAALAKEIAPNATISSATTNKQDPHFVQARPSLIAKVRRADLLICSGAELEIGWLPALLMKANNRKVRDPKLGLLYVAEQVERLDQLKSVDRSMGDLHAMGNPHVHFSPKAISTIAGHIAARLQKLDPDNSQQYAQSKEVFVAKWQQAVINWQAQAQSLNEMKIMAYHTSYRYLFAWLGIKQVADLEPKPGLPPTSGHLASLLKQIKAEPVSGVVFTSYQDPKPAAWLAAKSGIKALQLPYTVADEQTLFELYQATINGLLEIKKSVITEETNNSGS